MRNKLLKQLDLFPLLEEPDHSNALWDAFPLSARKKAVECLATMLQNSARPPEKMDQEEVRE